MSSKGVPDLFISASFKLLINVFYTKIACNLLFLFDSNNFFSLIYNKYALRILIL
jgi:hypothetical protein